MTELGFPGAAWRALLRGLAVRIVTAITTGLLVAAAMVVLPAPAALAYNVCADDGACIHEYMADQARALFTNAEVNQFWADIQSGAGHEDEIDHVYGLSGIGEGLITVTHFWDADRGPEDPVENVLGAFPNAWQKMQSLWSLALGAYTKGDKKQAYHWLGHVAHLIGDHTIPTHVHDDMHGPDVFDDDAFEEWMSQPNFANAGLSQAEKGGLTAAGPIQIPADQPDKLLWLLYTTNQVADFFASDDFDGDSNDPRGWARAELDRLAATPGLTRLQNHDELRNNDYDPVPAVNNNNNDDGDLSIIRQHSYLNGIRAIAALYKLFEETVAQRVQIAIVVDHVEEDEDHDFECVIICVKISNPDFYARPSISGRTFQNRGDEIVNDNVIDPGWAFGSSAGTSGSVPIRLEIWDHDGDKDDPFPFGGSDDQSDIDPRAGDSDRSLDMTVDLAKCLRREPGGIAGDVTGKCGDTLISTGDDDDHEASQVRFRILMSKSPPTAEAGGPYTTTEGTDVMLDGTGSTDPDNDITSYAWDLDGDGACDDVANDARPNFTAVGQDGITTVKLCVTDASGMTAEDTATVMVTNVTPAISAGSTPAGENNPITVTGTITDPGWLDPLSGTISWGDGGGPEPLGGTVDNARPDATLTFTASHTYGDNGTFTAQVCAADDDTAPCTTVSLQVDNTAPTAAIDLSGAVVVNGTPTIIAHAGQGAAFSGRSTDPGSDDLTLTWNWGDGTPATSRTSLVNPPTPDPPLSPSIQPRDVTDARSHAFGGACVYESKFTATDDDGATAFHAANVIITGNGHPNRPHGYWKQQFRHYVIGQGPSDFDRATLSCYLKIASYMSRVFDEITSAATFAQAYQVLDVSSRDMPKGFDLQLLSAWLNFANGAIEHDRLVDTNTDGVADTKFLDAITAAESLRLNPTTTRQQLDRQARIIESWLALS